MKKKTIITRGVIPGVMLVGSYLGTLAVITDAASQATPSVLIDMTDPMTQDIATMELAAEHQCSRDGEPGVIPAGSIIWRDNQPVYASFDEGWAVYQSGTDVNGVLLAVCVK